MIITNKSLEKQLFHVNLIGTRDYRPYEYDVEVDPQSSVDLNQRYGGVSVTAIYLIVPEPLLDDIETDEEVLELS